VKTKLVYVLIGAAVLCGLFLLLRPAPPTPPPPGKDANGDPLPPWAVARIGRFVADPVRPPLRFSEDGRTVLAAIGDGEVGTVDVATGEILSRTRVHEPSPGTVRVKDGRILTSLLPEDSPPPRDPVRTAAFSPDGKLVLLTSYREARVIDVATGETVRTIEGYEIQSARFTPDGSGVAIGADLRPRPGSLTAAGEVRIVELRSGRAATVLSHPQPIGIALSGDGSRVAVNGWYFLLASLENGEEILRTPKFGMGRRAVAFSADGRSLARFEQADTDSDPELVLNDATAGAERWRATLDRRAWGIAFSPDGTRVVVGGRSIRLYDASDGYLFMKYGEGPQGLGGVTFSPDGKRVAATRLGRLLLFEAESGKPANEPSPPFDPPGPGASALDWSDDSTRLVTGGLGGEVHLWDAGTGKHVRPVSFGTREIRRIRIDSAGGKTATVDAQGRVGVDDLATGAAGIWLVEKPNARIAFRDGRLIRITAVPERGYRVEDGVSEGLLPSSVVGHRAMSLSRDGGLLATKGLCRRILVWDTRALTARNPATPFTANHVAFSPDGRFLAAHDGGPIRVHDAATGETLFEITAYGGSSHIPLAVSPGGKLVAWAGQTSVVELWSVRRGKRCTRLPGHSGRILELAFSPDGKRLASRSADGTILIWDVSAWS